MSGGPRVPEQWVADTPLPGHPSEKGLGVPAARSGPTLGLSSFKNP